MPLFVFIYSLVCIPLLLYSTSELSYVVNYGSDFFLYRSSSSLPFFQKFSQRKHYVGFLVPYPWDSLCVSPTLFIYISRERLAEKRKHEGSPTNCDQPQFSLCTKSCISRCKVRRCDERELRDRGQHLLLPLLWAWSTLDLFLFKNKPTKKGPARQ